MKNNQKMIGGITQAIADAKARKDSEKEKFVQGGRGDDDTNISKPVSRKTNRKVVNVILKLNEVAILQEAAARNGISLSAYMRQCALVAAVRKE